MRLKNRMDRLERSGRHDALLVFGALPEPGLCMIPETPQRAGESAEAWRARLREIGRRLYPHAQVIAYPQWAIDPSKMTPAGILKTTP